MLSNNIRAGHSSRAAPPHNPVSASNLAVTVGYSDGTEIQILPAIRTKMSRAERDQAVWRSKSVPLER